MEKSSPKVKEAVAAENTEEMVEMNQQTSIEEVLPKNTEVMEPILTENPGRFVLFPIEHDDIWAEYKSKRQASGLRKKLTLVQISLIGTKN